MKKYAKKDFPVSDIRRFLEPGPIVLVTSAWEGKTNIMTLGWHAVMEFSPPGLDVSFRIPTQFRNDSQEPRVRDQCAVR